MSLVTALFGVETTAEAIERGFIHKVEDETPVRHFKPCSPSKKGIQSEDDKPRNRVAMQRKVSKMKRKPRPSASN